MASPLCPARRRNARSRTLLALLVIGGVALSPLPASAEPPPGTSREAAELVAARAHDLEVLTERFNEAREELAATRRAAEQAAADLAAAEAALAAPAPTRTRPAPFVKFAPPDPFEYRKPVAPPVEVEETGPVTAPPRAPGK